MELAPVILIELTLADGSILAQSFSMQESVADDLMNRMRTPPPWLERPRKSWEHPQDPIRFSGNVKKGHESEAEDFLRPTPTPS